MKSIVLVVGLFLTIAALAQESSIMQMKEGHLDSLLNDLRSAADDQEKQDRNKIFRDAVADALNEPSALSYTFTKLETVGIIDSPDGKVRIFNWNVEQDDFSHKYYCFVLYNDERKGEVRVTELKDISFGMPSQPTEVIDHESWYGALYYRIIPVERGSRTIYTLLGWDHNSSLSQLKLIDAMYFTGSSVKFGSPIFKMGDETLKRVFFEHSKKTNMYLNYEPHRKRIMMDHLSPESPALKNFRSYYVPDMSYDAFVYEKKKWVLKEDVIGVNDGMSNTKKQEVTVLNDKGQLEKRTVKMEWQNPEDTSAPAGGSEHIAVTPDSETNKKVRTEEKTNSELDARIDKKDKRNPSDLTIVNGKKKKKRWWQGWRKK
jgi:hypothetical protein